MRHLALLLALTIPACVHVDRGLHVAQQGLAVVDVAVDVKAKAYADAVRQLRAYCAGDVACEKRLRVTDEDVARVLATMERFAGHYDQAAGALRGLADEWPALSAQLEEAMQAAKALRP